MVYGLKTLGALVKYVNQSLGIKRYPLFERNNTAGRKTEELKGLRLNRSSGKIRTSCQAI